MNFSSSEETWYTLGCDVRYGTDTRTHSHVPTAMPLTHTRGQVVNWHGKLRDAGAEVVHIDCHHNNFDGDTRVISVW